MIEKSSNFSFNDCGSSTKFECVFVQFDWVYLLTCWVIVLTADAAAAQLKMKALCVCVWVSVQQCVWCHWVIKDESVPITLRPHRSKITANRASCYSWVPSVLQVSGTGAHRSVNSTKTTTFFWGHMRGLAENGQIKPVWKAEIRSYWDSEHLGHTYIPIYLLCCCSDPQPHICFASYTTAPAASSARHLYPDHWPSSSFKHTWNQPRSQRFQRIELILGWIMGIFLGSMLKICVNSKLLRF